MAKKLKKLMAAFLALVMCMSMISTVAVAEETPAAEEETSVSSTIWYGDEMSVPVTAGTAGYTFQSVYTAPRNAYEMSNHMLSPDGGASNDIPQTLVLVPAEKDYTWTPNGQYAMGVSNYEVLFCCDAETGYKNGVHYKRLNLEDSDYYTAADAAHIRAIITNSYPYVSLEEMKANLKAEGFEDADLLTRAEIISAVQAAVWAYANDDVGEYVYSQTFDVPTNSQWGTVMHDYTNEMNVWWQTGKRKFSTSEEVGARITALAEHLKSKTAVDATKYQVVVSDIQISEVIPVQATEDTYKVGLQIALNNSGSSKKDQLDLTIYVDGEEVISDKISLDCKLYETVIEVKDRQTIKAVVEGVQHLPQGVYFYEPEGGRSVSQCLVGVAAGETNIHKETEVTLKVKPATADLVIQKNDENGKGMSGVAFDLYKEGEETMMYVDTYWVDETGKLVLEKLLPGKYELIESVTPEGYLVPTEDILFEVDEEGVLTVEESKSIYMKDGVLNIVNRPPHAAVVLTIDLSGTMHRTGNKMDGKFYLEVAKEKAKDFLDKYAASAQDNAKRMVAVVRFDTDATVVQEWVDVSDTANLKKAKDAISALAIHGGKDSYDNYVCTNFDAGVILSRNLLKQEKVKDIDRCFNIILSDGAPTVTVNADTDTVGTIKSSFWGDQKDADGVKYQNKHAGGGWTHPAEVDQTWNYLNGVKDETCNYIVNGEKKEGIFIVGVGGLMDKKLFNDAVYGTENGSRTDDVKNKPAAFNNVDALEGYTSDQIMAMTTGDWMTVLADRVNGTYVSAADSAALAAQFDVIIDVVKDTTALPEPVVAASFSLRSGAAMLSMRMGAPTDDSVVDEPVVDEPELDEPVVEVPVVEEPVLNVTVKGGKIASWTVTDEGVTAIYIAAKGKEPAVIWTSEEVDEDAMAAIIEELGADADAVVLFGLGKHEVVYQHNKNKTKTVTYTFETKPEPPAKGPAKKPAKGPAK